MNIGTIIVMALALLFGCGAKGREHKMAKSEQQIYDSLVQLSTKSGKNFCSGQNVKAPSGKHYVISAGHCASAIRDYDAVMITEHGRKYKATIIMEDPNSDLVLLKGLKSIPALDIAASVALRQEIRTFTHGLGLRAYKTSGSLIEYKKTMIGGNDFVVTKADADKCLSQKKHAVIEAGWGFRMCVIHTWTLYSTAFAAPGSSGGAVVDDMGDLVGAVSGGGDGFTLFVRLSDIQRFIANR